MGFSDRVPFVLVVKFVGFMNVTLLLFMKIINIRYLFMEIVSQEFFCLHILLRLIIK